MNRYTQLSFVGNNRPGNGLIDIEESNAWLPEKLRASQGAAGLSR
jgi:hypothetical protein